MSLTELTKPPLAELRDVKRMIFTRSRTPLMTGRRAAFAAVGLALAGAVGVMAYQYSGDSKQVKAPAVVRPVTTAQPGPIVADNGQGLRLLTPVIPEEIREAFARPVAEARPAVPAKKGVTCRKQKLHQPCNQ